MQIENYKFNKQYLRYPKKPCIKIYITCKNQKEPLTKEESIFLYGWKKRKENRCGGNKMATQLGLAWTYRVFHKPLSGRGGTREVTRQSYKSSKFKLQFELSTGGIPVHQLQFSKFQKRFFLRGTVIIKHKSLRTLKYFQHSPLSFGNYIPNCYLLSKKSLTL